jgi:hypothetical protein
MKSSGYLGMILLSIWLIATGLLALVKFSLPGGGVLLAILALAAGILLLLGSSRTKLAHNLGPFLLSIWLVVQGALELLRISFPQSGLVMAVLALAAGTLMLLRR